jgi:aldehyde dehydrogenase (NAD+)
MDIVRPTDRQVIAQVTLGDEEDTRRAIAAAKRAFATYGTSKPEDRAEILHRLHQAASARIDDLTAAMVEEYGGVVRFARPIVESAVNAFAAAEKALPQIQWTRGWDKTTVSLEPVGVSGLITAWNANVLFMCLKFASAVAAGCTVVIKPSEMSPLQARVLVEALHEAKLPNGLLNVVTGLGKTVGAELVRNPDVAKISFTGSVGVGESIMRDGAATMKRVTLELGGKSPTILLDDANLEEAIPAALGMAFLNSGQACAAGTRLLVPSKRLDAVKRAIADAMHAFPVGDPADSKTVVGPMVSQKQFDRVQSYIRKGIEEGAEVLVGEKAIQQGLRKRLLRKAYSIRGSVSKRTDAKSRGKNLWSRAWRDCHMTRRRCDQIAATPLWSSRRRPRDRHLRARRVASQFACWPSRGFNGMTDDPQAPWGGFKFSGVGREYGAYGISAFLETRAILEVA